MGRRCNAEISRSASGNFIWGICTLNQPSQKEKNGIVFRRISAITAPDAWHVENGFIGSVRQAQAFMWDKGIGDLQAILNSNVR